MADAASVSGNKGGFRGSLGARGCGQGKQASSEWIPVTKLGRLVKDKSIDSLGEIYLYSLPIKEVEITEYVMGSSLKEEVLKIIPVQKQTRAGQRKRFKTIVAIDDCNCYVGLGVKCSKEVATKTQVILPEVKVHCC